MPLLRLAVRPVLFVLAIAVVLFEETIWRWLTALGGLLVRLPFFSAVEHFVERLSPRAVVAVFLIPFGFFVPLLKFGEIWLFVHGHLVLGVALLIVAKVLGVAFSARLFAIARPKMLQVRSFAWLYGHVVRLLALGHAYLEAIPAWATVKVFMRHIGHVAHAVLPTAWKFLRARMVRPAQGRFQRRFAATIRAVRRPPVA